MTEPNLLYYGDNLDVLRRHVKDDSVDLVYLDPPFRSNADYNMLFAEHGRALGTRVLSGSLPPLGSLIGAGGGLSASLRPEGE